MFKRIAQLLLASLVCAAGYLLLWPVPIEPVAWAAPPAPGYVGAFARNTRLRGVELLSIGAHDGPEDVALDREGHIYGTTHSGFIVRLESDGTRAREWADTEGRPLGIDFDANGNLIVADAYRGLLSIAPDATVSVLATRASGSPILYADDVDVANDGKIYFSDASTKFAARDAASTMAASRLDLLEHGGYGRLVVYDPATQTATTLLDGLYFANGVAVSHDQQSVLVVETGAYRIIRFWLDGPRKGTAEPLVENLPGFPDNVSTGLDGRYWIALIAPRNALVDHLSTKPFLRKVVQRLPMIVQPAPELYGHVLAIDDSGKIVADLQDPTAGYPMSTSVIETDTMLYLGSLSATGIGRLSKSKAGL